LNSGNNNSIKFFICLRAGLNSQWPVTESARIQTTTEIRPQNKTNKNKRNNNNKNGPAKAFYTRDLLKISVNLQIAFAAETHFAEGYWLKKQLNVVKLRMFPAETGMRTVSRTEEQHLVPLKTFIKNKTSK
jgi:hypothetical protein